MGKDAVFYPLLELMDIILKTDSATVQRFNGTKISSGHINCRCSNDYYGTSVFPSSISNISNRKMNIGIPMINPHIPRKCSENNRMMKVKNVGRFVFADMNFGFKI